MFDALARLRPAVSQQRKEDEAPPVADPLADLLLSVAAVIILGVIAILPTIPRQASRVDRVQAFSQDWHFKAENRTVRPFFATRQGLLVGASSSLVPVERIFFDESLVATLEQMRRTDEPIVIFIEPGGHEAAFQFEVMASRYGSKMMRQVRLDSECSFAAPARIGRFCSELLRPIRGR